MQKQKSSRGTIDIMKERFVREALKRSDGKRKETALLLGITERTLYRMIDKYNI